MHELSLMKALVGQVAALAQEHRARLVRRVTVRVGALGHAGVENLQSHFDRQALGTIVEGATLDVVDTDELIDLALDSVELDLPET